MDEETNDATKGDLESLRVFKAALRGIVGEARYKSWFDDLALAQRSEERVVLTTPSQSKCDMLDTRFMPLLAQTWRETIGPVRNISLAVRREALSKNARAVAEKTKNGSIAPDLFGTETARAPGGASKPINAPLDPRRTFDAFAVGDSNRIAWAAAKRATPQDGPRELIYIYGPSGVGKTHLLQAIAHKWNDARGEESAAYVTYSSLVNACVGAVFSKATGELHDALLSHSLLGFDDVHFLGGKNRTQEELLIVIDAALDRGKQVVVAGELAPAKLAESGISQRLADRLAGGICAPMEQGDEALRLAVLRKRLEQSPMKCSITDEALQFVARNFTNSMRETIGALNQILLMYGTEEIHVDLDAAKAVLKSRLQDSKKVSTIEDAIAAGAEAFGLELQEMTGRVQQQRVVRARHAVVWCAREVLKESFPRIGRALKRDHTTVMSSYRRAEALLERDKNFQSAVARVRDALDG